MASIRKELVIAAPPDEVWAALREVGAAHRLFRGVLVDTRLEGNARVVTFANGMVVRELIVDIDDAARRLAYAAVGGRATHHNASFQVSSHGEAQSRVVWVTDLLPDEIAGAIRALVEQGAAAMKQTLESGRGSATERP